MPLLSNILSWAGVSSRLHDDFKENIIFTLNIIDKSQNKICGATEKKYEAYYPEGNSYYQLITGSTENLTYVGG